MGNIKNIIEHFNFVSKKPRVVIRIINGFFRKMILRQKVLRTIDWAMLYECNFKCKFCSQYYMKEKNLKYLTPDQIKNVWEQAIKLGVIHVNITGGEPTLMSDEKVCQLIKNFQPNRFLVSLVSNGSLLTQEKLKKFKDAGLDTLQLSLESATEDEHDKIRNFKGSYNKIIQAVQWAKYINLNVCLSVVVTHKNIDKIWELVELTKKLDTFLLLNPLSTFGGGESENRLTKEDLEKYNRLLKTRHVRADTIFNFNGKCGCPGGKERIHITAYGDVITCPLVQVSYGNVLKEPLKTIHERLSKYEHIKKRSSVCKQAFDEDYYKKIYSPLKEYKKMPVNISEHPSFKNDKPN